MYAAGAAYDYCVRALRFITPPLQIAMVGFLVSDSPMFLCLTGG